jgi:uncharacterized protein
VGPELVTIQQTIDRRVSHILAGRSDWPCRKGCEDCCRHLAAIPEITEAEWKQLRIGLDSLSAVQRKEVALRVEAMREFSRPYTCPLLDLASGSCLVYTQRPIACRTYGFYVERDRGLYCHRIETLEQTGELRDVIWGNQTAIDDDTARLGSKRSLVDWLANG